MNDAPPPSDPIIAPTKTPASPEAITARFRWAANIAIIAGDAAYGSNTHDVGGPLGGIVRVLGTVSEPLEGNNAMGGNGSFPTVEAKYME